MHQNCRHLAYAQSNTPGLLGSSIRHCGQLQHNLRLFHMPPETCFGGNPPMPSRARHSCTMVADATDLCVPLSQTKHAFAMCCFASHDLAKHICTTSRTQSFQSFRCASSEDADGTIGCTKKIYRVAV